MKKGSNTRSVILGIFIATGILLFVLAVLALSGQRKTFSKTITAKAVFNNVSGLQNGANILYSGVKVGIVKSIQLLPASRVLVLLQIDDDKKQLIPADVIATVGAEGLIGNKVVTLEGGTPNAAAITDGITVKSKEALSMDALFATLQINNNNLVEVTGNLKTISNRLVQGQGSLGKLINDEHMYDDLQRMIAVLNKTSVNAQNLTGNLVAYTSKMQRPGSLTNDLLTDTVLFSRLRSATRKLDQLSTDAKTIVYKLDATTNNLSDKSKPAGLILNDDASAEKIKSILQNVETSSIKLNETLEALQHNFLLRGYFKKKAKAEAVP